MNGGKQKYGQLIPFALLVGKSIVPVNGSEGVPALRHIDRVWLASHLKLVGGAIFVFFSVYP